ncbi:MAG TPA: O-antigen ligase family protein [Clostridiales bacterium]|nr:O-antigen ligase family protein [Clostridiales bacterium]
MENTTNKKPNWFNVASIFFTNLYDSELPMIFLAIMVFFSWLFSIEAMAMITAVIYTTIAFIFIDDTAHLIAPLLLIPFMFSNGNADVSQYFWLSYFFIFIVLALIFHMFYYKKRFKLGKMFWPQVAISIALLLGGVGNISGKSYMNGFATSMTLGILILVLYYLFYQYRNPKSELDSKKFLAKVLLWAGIIVGLQVITYHIRSPYSLLETFNQLRYKFMELGWGIDNNAATMLLITAPMTLYLACRKDTAYPFIYVLLGAFQYICILLTKSRGGILAGAITAIISIIMLIKKTPKRKQVLLSGGLIILAMLIVFAVKFKAFVGFFDSIPKKEIANDSGRFKLYKEAWNCFLKHPLVGVGMGYVGTNFELYGVEQYFFHSTLFQVMASTGLVGIAAYLYHYIVRFKIIFKNIKKSTFIIFVFISMLGFEGYSMIDTGTFIPVPFMFSMIIMTMFVEEENEQLKQNQGKQNRETAQLKNGEETVQLKNNKETAQLKNNKETV